MQWPAASAEETSGRWRTARRVGRWIAPEENPAGTIYGVITVGALLAAEGAAHETHLETVASVAVTMSLYGFAHAYSEQLGERLQYQRHLNRPAVLGILRNALAIVRGASLPLISLLIAWVAGVSQDSAVTIAVWTAVVSLVALEFAAGIRAHEGPAALATDVAVGIAMGLGILALKAIVA
jgi:hypothetical protein